MPNEHEKNTPQPLPLEYRPHGEREPSRPFWPSHRWGLMSWGCLLLAIATFLGMRVFSFPRSNISHHLSFILPIALTIIGVILGVCGVLFDRHKAAAIIALLFNLLVFAGLWVLYSALRPSGNGAGVGRDPDPWSVEQAAEAGNANAQYRLGHLYETGEGVEKDLEQAVVWYRKAAEQGLPAAQFDLAHMYACGSGVTEDQQQAAKWYRKAAEQGDADAQVILGTSYKQGDGVPIDLQEAVVWFRKAAEQGHVAAQDELGHMYAEGHGVPKDIRQAVAWYRKAAQQGYNFAEYDLGVMYARGDGVDKDLVQADMWLSLTVAHSVQSQWGDAVTLKREIEAHMTPAEIEKAQNLCREFGKPKQVGN